MKFKDKSELGNFNLYESVIFIINNKIITYKGLKTLYFNRINNMEDENEI